MVTHFFKYTSTTILLTFLCVWAFLAVHEIFLDKPKATLQSQTIENHDNGFSIQEQTYINNSDNPGEVIYRTRRTIKRFENSSDYLRLPIPTELIPKKTDLEVILMGGSFVQGEGLIDEDTLPYRLQTFFNRDKQNVSVRVLARGGRSFSNLYQKLLNGSEIYNFTLSKKTKKHFFYLHPSFHKNRAYLDLENLFYNPKKKYWPYFEITSQGTQLKGTYSENFPLTVNILLFFKKIKILTNLSFPFAQWVLSKIGITHINQNFQIKHHFILLDDFGKALKKRYPDSTFSVIEFPFFEERNSKNWTSLNHPLLKIPISEEERKMKPQFLIKHDGHPNSKMIDLVTPRIYLTIKEHINSNK